MKKLRFSLLSLAVAAALLLPALPARAEGLELTAPSAVLMEASTGRVLFEKDPHALRSCASITKVMTLCLVFEAIDSGRLSLDQTLTASAHAASMGGSDIWLEEGEAMSVDDLIKATVIMSANDAAVVLAEAVSGSEEAFVEHMNQRAKELGCQGTHFVNVHGFHDPNHYTTTLSISPMKNAPLLNQLGEEIGREFGVAHLPSDFKKKDGYKRSVQLSKEYDLYRQDYCGCAFSKAQRQREKEEREEV